MGRNVNYHNQAAEVTDGIWKAKASWGHQKQGSFQESWKISWISRELGSEKDKTFAGKQTNKQKTCIGFHHRNFEGDVCPGFGCLSKKDAEEIFKLKMIVGHWLCLGVLRKLWKVCCRRTMFLGCGNTEALQKYVLEGFWKLQSRSYFQTTKCWLKQYLKIPCKLIEVEVFACISGFWRRCTHKQIQMGSVWAAPIWMHGIILEQYYPMCSES